MKSLFCLINSGLQAINAVLKKVLGGVCAAIMALLCIIVLWGIITRYIMGEQAQYTDEASRMLLIIITFMGAAYAFGTGSHIGFDTLFITLSDKAKKTSLIISNTLVVIFLTSILIYGGICLVNTSALSNNTLSSMPIKMCWVYLCVPLSGTFALFFTLGNILNILTSDEGQKQ